ncbi:MAG: T9SS type A sorting domain-containing protein [Bacteroidota bacterium]|nr:T9SS type A sorting domain-containing protein [Bacteroidota bacterium]
MKIGICSQFKHWSDRPLGRLGSILFAVTLAFCIHSANAQISVYVEYPESITGPLDFTWSDTWAADLDSAELAVTAPLVLVDDGTEADSLGCTDPLVNSAELTGNIALVYRGVCEFGAKALNAEMAGAVGVIIINNVGGAPVGMAAGEFGDQVTIPVVMISDVDGVLLRENMLTSDSVVVRIGSLTGVFPFNLGFNNMRILLPEFAAAPSELVMGSDDFTIPLGAWIYNYGNQAQSNVSLQVEIMQNGSSVYNETSTADSIPLEDSAYFQLPVFDQAPYTGRYEVTYTIVSDSTDAYDIDNVFTTSVQIGDIFSYAEVDDTTGIPETNTYYSFNSPEGSRSCIYFSHPNASRVAATGMYVNFSAHPDSTFAGNFVAVQVNEWSITDPTALDLPTNETLNPIEEADHILTDEERGETFFIPFLNAVALEDNSSYLFCVVTNENLTYHGYDGDLMYDQNMETNSVPVTYIYATAAGSTSLQWFDGTLITPPSIGVHMIDVNTIGINENERMEITPFPNPTADQIKIPVAGQSGLAMLNIFDIAGAKVSEQQVNIAGEQLVVDMKGISNGTYMFNMTFTDGRQASFRVVVSR